MARWLAVDRERPGAVWRLAAYVALVVAAGGVASAVIGPLAAAVYQASGIRVIAFPWITLAAVALAHLVALRWIERRDWDAVGLGRSALAARPLARGTLVGTLAVGIPALLLLAAGLLRVVDAPGGGALSADWWRAAGAALLVLAPAALFEELLVRGYPFLVLREAGGVPVAAGVTSVVFGVLHLQNPGATWSAVALVTLAGLFLSAVLVTTRSLWAAFAAHLAWNWTMAALLHAAVSGLAVDAPGYRVVDAPGAGDDWLTGGAWGPEGGAGAAAGMLLALGYLWRRHAGGVGAGPHAGDPSSHARPLGRGSEHA